jgi:predicted RecB family nuclease
MKLDASTLRLAASDITTFAACPHATNQALAVARKLRPRPPRYPDPSAELLRERGNLHEAAYLAKLHASHRVVELPLHSARAADLTLDAMRAGADVIYQGTLARGDRWLGRPDFLLRVATPSPTFGRWSYEVADAKLALSPKASALLQLCFYADLLTHAQGVPPRRMTLVLGDMREESFLTASYAAYFRTIRARFEEALATPPATYPEPVEHCRVCDYAPECENRRRTDDHLSLVAGITTRQRRALEARGVRTVRALAQVPLVRPSPIEDIGFTALTRIREQARIQIEGRDAGAPRHELLAGVEAGHGLGSLPAPSPGDLFIDFEGDPYALGDGLEYLFGIVDVAADGQGEPPYTGLWAFDRASELDAFRKLVALIGERRARHPGMHVYHYNHYEPTALKKLAGRHAACVDELDELLRGHVFVDLYKAVRQGVRASVESYSIKKLEPLFGFSRAVELRDARRCLAAFESWLELRPPHAAGDAVLEVIGGYNRDDCLSALRLRDWLEERRRELEEKGTPVARPSPVEDEGKPDKELGDALARVQAVAQRLLDGVPASPEERTPEQTARYVLAHTLDWHRREDKSMWWEYYRLTELTDEQLQEERAPIGGLEYVGEVGKEKRSVIHRYRFPPQDHALDRSLAVHDPRTKAAAGTLVLPIDEGNATLDLKRGRTSTVRHPTALIPCDYVGTAELRASLLRLGEHVADSGLVPARGFAAAIALLRREAPRGSPDESAVQRALAVDGSVLPVQGPPGTGKTHLGAEMIEALLRAGKRVGITANSHKVITHLLDKACERARATGTRLRAIQRCDKDDARSAHPFVQVTGDNDEVPDALRSGRANLAAGTAWLWSRAAMTDTVDVLFVDEAGQMSLANVLAAASASNGLVLLGDPQQLEQPQKGVHPPGTSTSALGHILAGHATMEAEHGVFLEETWRMHPDVCGFVSEAFYDTRVRSRPALPAMRLDAPGPLGGTGLRFLPVPHLGNRSESAEEGEAVARLVRALLGGSATWTDQHGETRALEPRDILVVAPYNAHVALLRARVPAGVHVGTVDKFQGQEAPVVVYSMATSTPEDAPRGMEFLYSGNRLNVAISRARCAAFLVASPALFDVPCKSPRQMALVNAFCRYLEVARRVELGALTTGSS